MVKITVLESFCKRLASWFRFRRWRSYRLTVPTLDQEWHDVDTQILNVNFQLLVNFVECECAWMNVICSEESSLSLLEKLRHRLGFPYRSREEGLKYLRWEEELRDDNGKLTPQAENAKITRRLYWWWTEERRLRKDPWDWSNEETYLDEILSTNEHDDFMKKTGRGEKWKKRASQALAQEERYYREDTKKLKELMDIRSSLWT